MLFSCHSSLLNSQVKFSQGNYIIWHTCPADDLKKKNRCGCLSWYQKTVQLLVNTLLMLQFLGSNTLNTLTNTSNKHAFYGVKGGTPLRNRCDRQTSIAWPNAKLISPAVNSALDWTSWQGQKLVRPRSLTLNGTMSWPLVSIVQECRQFSSLTYLPSTTSRLRWHVLDRTRRGIKER